MVTLCKLGCDGDSIICRVRAGERLAVTSLGRPAVGLWSLSWSGFDAVTLWR